MYDATNHMSYGSGVTYFNEVRKRMFSILENVIAFFYFWFYNTAACGYIMQPPNTKAVSGHFSPLLMLHITFKKIRTL